MTKVELLLTQIREQKDCFVYPPVGLPTIHADHILPDDVKEFYGLCDGVSFNLNSGSEFHILSAYQITIANPLLLIGTPEDYMPDEDDISWAWYAIAHDSNGNYITIDFGSKRLGRCYDSHFPYQAVQGTSPIIALSFTEFLERFFATYNSQDWYWEVQVFQSYGDAYDGVTEKQDDI